MTENEISIKGLEKQAFRKRLKSYLPGIIVSVGIIIVTAVLVYFYPKIECNKRLLFLISSVWPSGVIVVLVPLWVTFVRDLMQNRGYDIYRLLQEAVLKKFHGSSKETYFLMRMQNRREELQSADKATRAEALKDIVEEINGDHQSQ